MSSSRDPVQKSYVETGGEPEFFCTEIKLEDAGNGNIRIFAYSGRHQREMHLLFTVVVPAESLSVMARQAQEAAAQSHNGVMWKGWTGDDDGDGSSH